MVRIALMYYVDFYSLFNNPEKEEKHYYPRYPGCLPSRRFLAEGACKFV